ncbi:hypothetical protein WAI453_001606 [Rhynchosporium graminicola]|uniref:Related to tRNA splicing endonuclease delta subunit n=1 Tax=Rhynchosporium graminicola TaxID=2792576 RepID=A0A1E1KCL6_9HELO|nr:related to tRNA splicing endonuclease delta subunit [Rhynchosporium commune]
MAPSATISHPPTSPPPPSALSETLLQSTKSPHPPHLHNLALQIQHDLLHQHDWTLLQIHTHSPLTTLPLPRPLISGLPPRRAYIHPDEQVEILKAEHKSASGERSIAQKPEREWVLPTQLMEKMSLRKLAELFDAVGTVPPGGGEEDDGEEGGGEGEMKKVGWQWQGENRQKRILLATLHDDSTVVYYIMHDGIVKPRQN